MSVVFFIGRKIRRFFQGMRWNEEEEDYYFFRRHHREPRSLPVWKGDLLWEYPNKVEDKINNYRIIEIR